MKKLYLQCPWRMNYDEAIGKYELENCQAGLYYQLQSPSQFASFGDWLDHIERTANVGFSPSYYTLMGELHGKYWKAGSAGNSGSAQVASAGSGRATATIPPDPFYEAVCDAVRSGAIPSAAASAYYSYLKSGGSHLTGPATHSGNYLGAGYQQASMGQVTLNNYAAQAAAAQAAAQYLGLGLQGSGTIATRAAPHAATDLKSEAMVAGEIIAWRAWKVVEGGLASVVAEVKPWSATEPMVGDPASGYGVHAYKGPHGPLLDGYVSASSSEKWVIGEVALWGDVIEHEEGYRAEFARVHSLVTWSEGVSEAQRELIKTAYLTHCPVHKIDDAA